MIKFLSFLDCLKDTGWGILLLGIVGAVLGHFAIKSLLRFWNYFYSKNLLNKNKEAFMLQTVIDELSATNNIIGTIVLMTRYLFRFIFLSGYFVLVFLFFTLHPDRSSFRQWSFILFLSFVFYLFYHIIKTINHLNIISKQTIRPLYDDAKNKYSQHIKENGH